MSDFCETSLEYDLFEEMRRNLSCVLVGAGRDPVEAERVALYVMQGVREVPKLLNALASGNAPAGETLKLLGVVLEGASSLDRARVALLGQDDKPVH